MNGSMTTEYQYSNKLETNNAIYMSALIFTSF